MKRVFLALVLVGCGGSPMSREIPGRESTDSVAPSALTDIRATAEIEQEALGPLPIRTEVSNGALRVAVGVGPSTDCSFGQSDGPSVRDVAVEKEELALELDEKDAHAWLYGGASIACEGGEKPLFAWSLLEPHVSAPKVDLSLDGGADAMLSDKDTYVVRVRGHALEPVKEATLVLGSSAYAGKVTELRDEITHWEVTFDVPPEKWVASVLRGENGARLTARIDSSGGERDVDAAVTLGLEARITDASHQPLEDE